VTFLRKSTSFHRLSDAHPSSLVEVQGEPERKQEVRVVMTSGSQGDRENCEKKVPYYCMVEMINTSAGTIEIGKNVKIGEGELLELSEAEIITEEICADSVEYSVWRSDSDSNCRQYDVDEDIDVKGGSDKVESDSVSR
jgi:hypothetical protein